MLIYVGFVVGIGFALSRYMKTGADFFLSGRSIPAWVCGLAFLSANLGALELVGMAASGAKYGIATCHFYWLGAIPGDDLPRRFHDAVLLRIEGALGAGIPEAALRRADAVRSIRCTFAVMTVFASGISMDAAGAVAARRARVELHAESLRSAPSVVLVYVLKGGLTSAIYTEVLQFFMIVLGFSPVVYLGLKDVGGWGETQADAATRRGGKIRTKLGRQFTHSASRRTRGPARGSLSLRARRRIRWASNLFAMVFGLGFVMSFGYWCTNFLVIQRAMAAKNMTGARRTPLVAAVAENALSRFWSSCPA